MSPVHEHPVLNSFRFALNVLILVTLLIIIIIALISFTVLWRTSILHRNLKTVLIAQNAGIIGISANIAYIIGGRLVTGNFGFSPPHWMGPFTSFFGQFVILIGHVLLAERILATVLVEHYEHWKRPHFSVAWATLLIAICLFNACTNIEGWTMTSVLVINTLALLISLVEIFVMAKLGVYNAAKFASLTVFYARRRRHQQPSQQQQQLQRNLSLTFSATAQQQLFSERYQLAENVRTIRSLGPVFVAHFCCCLAPFAGLGLMLGPEQFPGEPLLEDAALFAVVCCYATIIGTVVLFHPVLRSKALTIKRRMFHCRNGTATVAPEMANGANGESFERHFQLLREQWA